MKSIQGLVILFVAALALANCDERSTGANEQSTRGAMLKELAPEADGGEGGNAPREANFAYTHNLRLEMEPETVAPRFERARQLCLEDDALNCSLLDSEISGRTEDRYQRARLTMRLPHTQIIAFERALLEPIVGEEKASAEIVQRATSAEDLSRPVFDNEQRIAQLNDYLVRLEALTVRSDLGVDDLIKLSREISQTQNSIESIAAIQREMHARIDGDTLTIDLRSRFSQADELSDRWNEAWAVVPISALEMLTFVLGALPWLPVVVLGFVILGLGFRLIRALQPKSSKKQEQN